MQLQLFICMQLTLENKFALDDQSLVDGLLQHIPKALEGLQQKYHGILKSTIMQVLHNSAEADDVLQEVLLQVWGCISTYSSKKGKLISWLCTLARRRAIDHVRQCSAYQRATDRYENSDQQHNKKTKTTNSVAVEVDRDDLQTLLQHHLKELPPTQQLVIRMAYFEERSQREIALLTQTPLGTVKTRLELGIKKLSVSIGGLRDEILV